MKLSDRRLYQARTLQDLRFRLGFLENDHAHNEREHFDVLYQGASFERKITAVLVEPNYFQTWGTDHSDWDGNVDFKPMKQMGGRFTFIKAMEGTVPSKRYVDNTLRAQGCGLAVAPYHWLHQNSKVNCKLQAQEFWKRVSPYVKKLPPMIDHEWTYWAGAAAYPSYLDLDIFVTEFSRVSGIKPLWYSAPGYMNMLGRMPASLRAKFAGFVVANYGVLIPNMPLGFGPDDWDFWQFAATGNATKITPNDANKKEVDLIYADFVPLAFDNKYGTAPQPEPPTGEPMPETIKEGTVSAAKLGGAPHLNIRNGAGGSGLFSDIGNLYPRDRVFGKIVSAVWIEFDRIIRVNGVIENFHGFASTQFMDMRDVPVEPPTPDTVTITGATIRLSDGTTREMIVKP